MKLLRRFSTTIVGLILLAACQNTPTNTTSNLQLSALPPSGDLAKGQALFESSAVGSEAVPCSACHSVQGIKLTGPALNGIALTAASRVPGQDAETYLFNSIVNPNQHILERYVKGVMPADYDKKFTPQQIRDLLTYLLTLR